MNRRTHRFVAFALMLGMLFAQLSVAAFACPLLVVPADAPPMPAMHEGCAGTHAAQVPDPAPANTALCELHCQTTVSVPSAPAPPVALCATAPLVVEIHDGTMTTADPRDVRVLRTAMATAPPVSILYCRLQV